jgi:hypothetical protein
MEDNKRQAIETTLQEIENWSEEYHCTHEDSGSNYAHLVAEGYHADQYDRLLQEIKDSETMFSGEINREDLSKLTAEWIEEELQDLIDDPEMRPGHIFIPSYTDAFIVDAFPVGEIEEQIEFTTIIETIERDHGITVTREDIKQVIQENRSCATLDYYREDSDHFYMYISTDAVWYAVIPVLLVEEKIKEFFEEQEEKLDQALQEFKEVFLPEIDPNDETMIRESYNDYLDSLNKEGTLHDITVFYADNPF